MSAPPVTSVWPPPLDTSAGGLVDGDSIVVEALASDRTQEWDTFAVASPGATFFHLGGWMRVVRDTYGHRPYYAVARDGSRGRLRGMLPLFKVSGPLTGRALVSVPYAVSGGVVAEDTRVERVLVAYARQLANQLGVRYLELRNAAVGEGLDTREHYYGFRTTMPQDPDQVLGRFPRKARAEIRKARDQHGLTARFGPELLGTFYGLYVRSLRRLGSPGHSWSFFRRLLAEFQDDCLVEVVYQGETPVAGVVSFRFRDQVLPYYAGIDDRYNRLNTSNFLYYALMEHAVRLGLRVFDFGRTRRDNEGGCQFKINQGFEPEPLTYTFYSPRDTPPPDLRPSNAAFSKSQAVWRRLPLPVAGVLGGVVSRWLP